MTPWYTSVQPVPHRWSYHWYNPTDIGGGFSDSYLSLWLLRAIFHSWLVRADKTLTGLDKVTYKKFSKLFPDARSGLAAVVAPTTPTGHTHKHYQPNLHNTVVPNWKYVNPRDIFVAELTLVIWTCMVQQKNKLFRYNTCILVGCEDMSCCHACLCLGGSMQ